MDNLDNFDAESLPPGVVADVKPEEIVVIDESNISTHIGSSNWKNRKLSLEFLLSLREYSEIYLVLIKSSIDSLLSDKIVANKALAVSVFFSYLKQLTLLPSKDINNKNYGTSASELSQVITSIIKNKIIADKKLSKTLNDIFEFILDNIPFSLDEIQSFIIKPLITELDQKSAIITTGCLRVVWYLYQTYGLDIMPGIITLNKLKNGINSPNKEFKELSLNVLMFLSEEENLGVSAVEYVRDKMNLKANIIKEIEKRYESVKGKEIKRDYKKLNFIELNNNNNDSKNNKIDKNDINSNIISSNINFNEMSDNGREEKDILLTYKKNFTEEYDSCIKWKEKIVLIEELKRICTKNKKLKFIYKGTKLEIITTFLINQLIKDRNSNVIFSIFELLNLVVLNACEGLSPLSKKLYPNCFVWFKEKRSSIESNLNSLIDSWFKLVSKGKLEDFMGHSKKYLTDKMPRNKICILNFIKRSCNLLNGLEDSIFTEIVQISISSFNDGNNEVRDLGIELFKTIVGKGKTNIAQKCLLNEIKTNEKIVRKFVQLSGFDFKEESKESNLKENTVKYKTIRKPKVNANTTTLKESMKCGGFIEISKLTGLTLRELIEEISKDISKVKSLREVIEMLDIVNTSKRNVNNFNNINKYKTIKKNKISGTVRGYETIKTIKTVKHNKTGANFGTVKRMKVNEVDTEQVNYTLRFINNLLSRILNLTKNINEENTKTSEDLNIENDVIAFLTHFNQELTHALLNNNINNMSTITEEVVKLLENIHNLTNADSLINILNNIDSDVLDTTNLLNVYQFIVQSYNLSNYHSINSLIIKCINLNNKNTEISVGEIISYILGKYTFTYTSNTDGNNYELDLCPFIQHFSIPLKQSIINKTSSRIDVKITPFNTNELHTQLNKLTNNAKAVGWELKKAVLENVNSLLVNNVILLIEETKDLEELKDYFTFIKGCLSDSNKKIVFLALTSLGLFVSKSADLAFFITTIVEMDDLVSCLNDKQQVISEEASKILVLVVKRTGDLCALNRLISIALSSKTPKKDKMVNIIFTFKKLITTNFLQANLPKFINLLFDKSYKVREFSSVIKEHCKDEQFKLVVIGVVNKIKKENDKKIITEAFGLEINADKEEENNNNNINNKNDNIEKRESIKGRRNTLPNSPTLKGLKNIPTIKSPKKVLRRVSMKQTKLVLPMSPKHPTTTNPTTPTTPTLPTITNNKESDNVLPEDVLGFNFNTNNDQDQDQIPQNLNISANCIELETQTTSTCSSSLFLDNIFEIDQKTLIKNEETLLKYIFELKEQVENKIDLINIYERLNKIQGFIESACPQVKTHLVSNGVVFKEFIKVVLKLSCVSLSLNYNSLKGLTSNYTNKGDNDDVNKSVGRELFKTEGRSFKLYDLLNRLLSQFLEERTKNKIEFIAGTWNSDLLYMFIVVKVYSLLYREHIDVEVVNKILVEVSVVVLVDNGHLKNVVEILFGFSTEGNCGKAFKIMLELFKLVKYLDIEVSIDIKLSVLQSAYKLYSELQKCEEEDFNLFVNEYLKLVIITKEELENSSIEEELKEVVLNTMEEVERLRSIKLTKLKEICRELTKHKNPHVLVVSFYECLEGDQELFKEATEELDEVYVNFLVRSIKRIEKSNEMKRKMVELNKSLFMKEEKAEQINKKEIINLLKKRLFNKKAKVVDSEESDMVSYPEVKNLIISPMKKKSYAEKISELRAKLKKFDKYK